MNKSNPFGPFSGPASQETTIREYPHNILYRVNPTRAGSREWCAIKRLDARSREDALERFARWAAEAIGAGVVTPIAVAFGADPLYDVVVEPQPTYYTTAGYWQP